NVAMSRNLVADAVIVATLEGRGPREVSDGLDIAIRDFARGDDGGLAGYVLNFAPAGMDYGALMA
ncbi:hypothetical protein, partial [Deinococcus pimensis]|uniref:hypothetical protein n=1 Tax=Deinococcus pimensis TaxID=309888 RepID=UPI0005EBDC17